MCMIKPHGRRATLCLVFLAKGMVFWRSYFKNIVPSYQMATLVRRTLSSLATEVPCSHRFPMALVYMLRKRSSSSDSIEACCEFAVK